MADIKQITKKQRKESLAKIFAYLILFLYVIITLPKLYVAVDIWYKIGYGLMFLILLFVTAIAIRIEVNVIKNYMKFKKEWIK